MKTPKSLSGFYGGCVYRPIKKTKEEIEKYSKDHPEDCKKMSELKYLGYDFKIKKEL